MKLLFAIKALNCIKGGAERVLADISSKLAEDGHDITVLTFDPAGGHSFYSLNKKIRRICLGIGQVQNRATVSETRIRMRELRRIVKSEKPDIVVPFMHSMYIPMAFALIGTGIPIIASEHTVPMYYKGRYFELFLLFLSSFFIKRITIPSEYVKKSYPFFLRRKMTVVYNPVHAAHKLSDPKGESHKRKIILSVGRLTPGKDIHILISAFQLLSDEFPDWDVRIVGDGELREQLLNFVKKYELDNRVFLPGATALIENEYTNANIFALPSRYESFGLATAEAMAHGLPCVGFSDCPGTNELIVNGKNGFLADGNDRVKSFSINLRNLMESPDLRISFGQAAIQSVQRFRPDIVVKQWSDLLEQVNARRIVCRGT